MLCSRLAANCRAMPDSLGPVSPPEGTSRIDEATVLLLMHVSCCVGGQLASWTVVFLPFAVTTTTTTTQLFHAFIAVGHDAQKDWPDCSNIVDLFRFLESCLHICAGWGHLIQVCAIDVICCSGFFCCAVMKRINLNLHRIPQTFDAFVFERIQLIRLCAVHHDQRWGQIFSVFIFTLLGRLRALICSWRSLDYTQS